MPTVRCSSSGRPLSKEDPPNSTQPTCNIGNIGSSINTALPQYFYVLPVLLLEFLALALTRAVLPGLLLQQYGRNVYLILGSAECVRGFLAFFACPLFGQVSDHLGRKPCLFVTVLGTCAPVCSLALWSWHEMPLNAGSGDMTATTATTAVAAVSAGATVTHHYTLLLPQQAMTLFVALLAISGLTSSTFTLVFCYISDSVTHKDERLSAYGLALATFGLSFTLGTLCGGYLAETGNPANVFRASCLLAVFDLAYIAWILPESKQNLQLHHQDHHATTSGDATSIASNGTATTTTIVLEQLAAWKPLENIQQTLWKDPFLRNVGILAFLYYMGLSAVISTISLYAVSHFHLSPQRLGELMSALGACTTLAEAVLVRFLVPYWGERNAIRIGLISFASQCFVLGVATEPWHLFVCVAFSLLANLVYPSLSSLVTDLVEPNQVGEALGSLNGVKALTEGIGPLVFGALFTWSEDVADHHSLIPPGWPYCVAAMVVLGAYQVATTTLPHDPDEYIHELEFKQRRKNHGGGGHAEEVGGDDDGLGSSNQRGCIAIPVSTPPMRDDEEYQDLLSSNQDIQEGNGDHFELKSMLVTQELESG